MEQTLKELVEKISAGGGEDMNFLIVLAQNKEKLGITAQSGDINRIAETLFYIIHQQERPLSMNVYQIIKLIVINMVKNNSAFARDLLTEVTQYISIDHDK